MRLINLGGRAHLLTQHGAVDVSRASDGKLPSDPQALYEDWHALRAWADTADLGDAGAALAPAFSASELGAPAPTPRQVFAVGLNYSDHAAEAGFEVPTAMPPVFTKFAGSLTGPEGVLQLSGDSVDWEVELVVVMAAEATRVAAADALDLVAGVTIGQDFSDRAVQMQGPAPQFSLAKSFPGYGPLGPELVTLDEVDDLDALRLRCWIDDELVQDGLTSQMIYSVPVIIERLSSICTLLPGDVIFTGTPAGVGMGRTPARYLRSGETVRTEITGLGTMTHRCA